MNELLEYFKNDELSANVWKSKYAAEGEETPDEMHHRMAKEFARIEEGYKKKEYVRLNSTRNPDKFISQLSPHGQNRKPLNEDIIFGLFEDFKYIVPQGSIMATLGTDVTASLSNCFVIASAEDSYGGILKTDEEQVQLMKRRGGVGHDLSKLRPHGTETKNSAKTSTGTLSFAERFSNSCREVAQNGRRGALMLSLSINHPDVLDFIKSKRDLTKLTGANISVKITDEFMKAVENDEDYILRFPCDTIVLRGTEELLPYNQTMKSSDVEGLVDMSNEQNKKAYLRKIKAKEYWDEIIKSAKDSAEPGILFEDKHNNHSPDGVYEQYRFISTNP